MNDKTHEAWVSTGFEVKKLLSALRRFLTAEEVPRWFGLSVVLIYFVGLMTVHQYALAATRMEAAIQFQLNSSYSIKLLADRLSALQSLQGCARILKESAVNIPASNIRMVRATDDKIVCSTSVEEIGKTAALEGEPGGTFLGLETFFLPQSAAGERSWMVRAPIAGTRDPGPVTREGPLRVEAVLGLTPPIHNRWVTRATMLAIVLILLGALFLMYRALREQLRGVSRIAHRLETHRDHLEQEIAALRINDEQDAITRSWNQLVEMTQDLLQTSRQKQADVELSAVLQRSAGGALAEALHAVPDGVIHIVEETRFEYLNSAACRLMGWKLQDANRTSLSQAQAEGVGAKILDLIRSSLLPEGRFEPRVELVEIADPQARDASSYRVWILPVQGARHNGACLVIIRDVSQQLRAEKAREEFIAQVTHEFRTPLTNIRAYTETLSSGMFEDKQTINECYNVINKETRRLSRLIEDILSISQLELGSIELQLDNVDLRTLLTESVRDVRGLADEKNIDVQLVLPAKLEGLRGDRDKLAVVINNLLGNAIKYTNAGGNVVVGCQTTADTVAITVKDNGIGISPEDQRRVFEKFQRGTDPQIQNITGTGLGLFTAREIVRRHGGDIELISEKGAGSTFMVKLPHQGSRASTLSTAQIGDRRG